MTAAVCPERDVANMSPPETDTVVESEAAGQEQKNTINLKLSNHYVLVEIGSIISDLKQPRREEHNGVCCVHLFLVPCVQNNAWSARDLFSIQGEA